MFKIIQSDANRMINEQFIENQFNFMFIFDKINIDSFIYRAKFFQNNLKQTCWTNFLWHKL